MKLRYLFFSLVLMLCLTACAGKAAESPLSPEQQAFAQTQFVQQAATSAAAYARTAQPEAMPESPEAPTAAIPVADTQTPGVPSANPTSGVLSSTPSLPASQPTPGSTQPLSPTNTRTSAPNPTPTRTAMPSATSTPTATATQVSGWQGDWMISFQRDDGSYLSGEISVTINGDQLFAEGLINGNQYQFTGKLASTGQVVRGIWSSTQTSGSFTWTLVTADQFGGDRDLMYGVCGARPGADMPNPCYIPPLS